jgi:hypothetical protein
MSLVNSSTMAIETFTYVPAGPPSSPEPMPNSRQIASLNASQESPTPITMIGERHYADRSSVDSADGTDHGAPRGSQSPR